MSDCQPGLEVHMPWPEVSCPASHNAKGLRRSNPAVCQNRGKEVRREQGTDRTGQTLDRTEFYSELELEGFKASNILLTVLLNLTKHKFFKFQAL